MMKRTSVKKAHHKLGFWRRLRRVALFAIVAFVAGVGGSLAYSALSFVEFSGSAASTTPTQAGDPWPLPLDTKAYDIKLLALAHVATSSPWYWSYLAGTTTPLTQGGQATTTTKERRPLWPVRAAYPQGGALLPANRILAYYGNFYSKGMGILGEYPENEVLTKLLAEKMRWEAADPSTPVVLAIEYIDVTAQASAGKDGKYRLRMPDSQIDRAIAMAKKVDGIVMLDIQVGLSTVPDELPLLDAYLKLPQVHVALDPEFAMHGGTPPGRVIGSLDATDINYTINYLANIVKENRLPPKILLIHRFTEDMVTHANRIKPLPEVQVVMQMDGWGFPAKKINTYNTVIYSEPVQFAGFKLFYKNDLKQQPGRLLTPSEVLKLTPAPIYIQYQ